MKKNDYIIPMAVLGGLLLLSKKRVGGIGSVKTNNPNITFLKNGIKVNGTLIYGKWDFNHFGNDVTFDIETDLLDSKKRNKLASDLKILRKTDITLNSLDPTMIFFSKYVNSMYYLEALEISREVRGIDKTFKKWMDSVEFEPVSENVVSIKKDGLTIGIIYFSDGFIDVYVIDPLYQKQIYILADYVSEQGWENIFG